MMPQLPLSLETALGLLIIGVCGIPALILALNRLKYRQWRMTAPRRNQAADFGSEVMARATYQRFEKSLTAILQTLESERQTLQRWIDQGADPRDWHPPLTGPAAEPEEPPSELHQTGRMEVPRMAPTEISAAARMAKGGMGINDICEKLMLPRESIELIVQMNQAQTRPSDPPLG